MLNLLSPDEIKIEKNRAGEETNRRTIALRNAESAAARNFNLTTAELAEERERIEQETMEFERQHIARRDTLLNEVESLEERKKEALKPIDEIRDQAKKTLSDAESRLADAKRAEKDAEALHERGSEALIAAETRNREIGERELDIEAREKRIGSEEDRISASSEELTGKWETFQEVQKASDQKLIEREQGIILGERANGITSKENEKEKIRLADLDRQLRDRYETLLRSEQESSNKNK